VPSAQSMLAYVDLQGFVGREGEGGYVPDTFDGFGKGMCRISLAEETMACLF
jgi:hypothetical protein